MAPSLDSPHADWFALLGASPRPELQERAAVGLVIGNGVVTRVAFESHLPRLRGVATVRQIAVFERLLRGAAERAQRGIEVAELEAMLGPQIQLLKRRELSVPVTKELIERLSDQYLQSPRVTSVREQARALRGDSIRWLDGFLESSAPLASTIVANATVKRLYDRDLQRYVSFRIPSIARAVRVGDADILIESLLIDDGPKTAPLREVASRASMSFFAFDALRNRIRSATAREVHCVGVLQHTDQAHADVRAETSEWVNSIWSPYAQVIEGDAERIPTDLRRLIAEYT